ncbi:MAG: VanW family protein [Chloroflexi bacterium]|nr:VanW family protein [Chloroflexota bacterium]
MPTDPINQPSAPNIQGVEQLLAAGYAALATNDHHAAETFFRQAVQADSRSIEAWRALADTQTGARHGICLRWIEYLQAPQHQPIAPPRRRASRPSYRLQRAHLIGVAGAGSLALLVLGSDLIYRDRALPGVQIGQIGVGHLRAESVASTLAARQHTTAQRIVEVRVGEQSWQAPADTLLRADLTELVQAALAYGHEPSFWSRTGTRMRSFLGQEYNISAPTIDQQAVERFVAEIASAVSRERIDAHVLRTEQGWTIVPEQSGQTIDQARLVEQIAAQLSSAAWQPEDTFEPLSAELLTVPPTRTVAQLEPLRQHLQAIAEQPLDIRLGDQQWTLDRSLLLDTASVIDPAALQPSPALIGQQLDPIAAQIAVAPQPSFLERNGDRIRSIVPGKVGRELDREAAIQAITAAINTSAPQLDLPIRELQPTPGEAEQLGLVAELGRGESQFVTYTSADRDANVQVGGNDIDGVLIAPGEVFSFTGTVGEITWEKGYRWGEAIEAGVSVPSLGGGICQVSTTVFRAAFWSGLEIVERHNHTWRLPWYEVDAPPGMDATIALGGPDFKFRNNTQHYILIKVETDLAAKRQTVIIYGTPDGRQVAMQPLNNGNIGIYRSVLSGTQLVDEDTFVSYYSQ